MCEDVFALNRQFRKNKCGKSDWNGIYSIFPFCLYQFRLEEIKFNCSSGAQYSELTARCEIYLQQEHTRVLHNKKTLCQLLFITLCLHIVHITAEPRSPEGVFPDKLIPPSASSATYYIITQQACRCLGSNKTTGCAWLKPASIIPVADRNHNLSSPPAATLVRSSSEPLSWPLLMASVINPSYSLLLHWPTILPSNPPSILSLCFRAHADSRHPSSTSRAVSFAFD